MELLLQIRSLVFSRVARGSLTLFFGNAASAVLGIVFTIFAARFLGPEDWGIVAAVTGLIPILVAITDFGISPALFQYTAGKWKDEKEKAQRAYRAVLAIRTATLLTASAVLLLFINQATRLIFKSGNVELLVFSLLGLIGTSLFDFQILAIESRQNWKGAAFLISTANIVRVLSVFLLWYFNLVSVNTILLSFVSGSLAVFLISLFWLHGLPKLEVGWKSFAKKFISFSAWMSGNKIISTVSSRLDVLILLNLAGSYETGIYAAAGRLAMGVPLIAGSFATVLASRFASFNEIAQARSFFKKSLGLSFLFALGIIFGIFVAPFIMSFFGEEYQRSVQVLQWLLVAIIPLAVSTPAVTLLIYYFKKPKIITYMSFVQLAIVLSFNYLFIPSLGVWAPVLAVGTSQFLTTVITYFFALKYLYRW